MIEVRQGQKGRIDDVVAAVAAHRRDESDTAGVVLEGGVVQPLGGWLGGESMR